MVGLSTLVVLGGHLEIWMLCTIHKYIFLTFLGDPTIVFPPTITLISLSGGLGLSSTHWPGSGSHGGFSHPWWTIVTSLTWWGLQSAAWGLSTWKYCAHGLCGGSSTCSWASCLDRPSVCLAKSVPCHLLSAWGLDPMGYLRGRNSSSSSMGVLTSCRPFGHLFGLTFLPLSGRWFSYRSLFSRCVPSGDHFIFEIQVFCGLV